MRGFTYSVPSYLELSDDTLKSHLWSSEHQSSGTAILARSNSRGLSSKSRRSPTYGGILISQPLQLYQDREPLPDVGIRWSNRWKIRQRNKQDLVRGSKSKGSEKYRSTLCIFEEKAYKATSHPTTGASCRKTVMPENRTHVSIILCRKTVDTSEIFRNESTLYFGTEITLITWQ